MAPIDRFDRNDDRLAAFTEALWKALVPANGECVSLQGELVRARGRLASEHFRNGMCNYYTPYEEHHRFADGFYPQMLLFLVDTLARDTSGANDAETIAWLEDVRGCAESDWDKQRRIDEIVFAAEEEGRELTEAQEREVEELDSGDDRIDWEPLLDRLEIAVANYCLANPALVDRKTKEPVEEGGVRDIRHVFDPPPPPPPCATCGGKGWLPAKSASDFPTMCPCKTSGDVLH